MEIDAPGPTKRAPSEILARGTKRITKKSTATASLPEAKKPSVSKPSNSVSTTSLLSKLPTSIQKVPSRSPRMQEALNRGNYRLDAVIDKLLAQTELPGNLTLGEYYVLLDRPRSTTSRTQSIDQKMQRQLKNATVESLCVGYSDDEDVFISERPLPTISVPSSINNYESENAAQRDYPSDDEPTSTSNEEKSEWRYKKDTPPGQSKKYRTWVERTSTHHSISRPDLALKLYIRQKLWRMEVSAAHDRLIEGSWLWLALGTVPTIGLFLVILVAIIKCYYSRLTQSWRDVLIKSNSLTPLFEGAEVCLLDMEGDQPATFHSPTPKIVVTIPGNTKISDVRATLDSGAEVSCITLETAIRLGLPITKSQSMALKTITGIKSRFIGYADNIAVTVGDLVVRTRFYIIDIPGTKIILGFPFFRKARLSFRYPSDEEGGPVLAQLWNHRLVRDLVVQTNFATHEAKDISAIKSENGIGRIWHNESQSDGYTSEGEDELSENE